MKDEPAQPIVIVSAGRSGSTLLHELLSLHPEVAWLPERLAERLPRATGLVRAVMRLVDVPFAGACFRRLFSPAEAYPFWEIRAPGFAAPRRDLTAADLTSQAEKGLRHAFAAITTRRRRRLLVKITGWPRLGYLSRLFPNAVFVHMARDPRAAVRSFLHAPWWQERATPKDWHWGPLSDEHAESWSKAGETLFALACIQMCIFWRAYERSVSAEPHVAIHELRYEELCRDPIDRLRAVGAATGLEWTPRFAANLRRQELANRDLQWQQEFTPSERALAEELLAPCLATYSRFGRPETTTAEPQVAGEP